MRSEEGKEWIQARWEFKSTKIVGYFVNVHWENSSVEPVDEYSKAFLRFEQIWYVMNISGLLFSWHIGRIKQLIELDYLNPGSIRLFILDEADKLLEEGSFQEQIK